MENRKPWYKRIIVEKKKEIISSFLFVVMFSVIVSAWGYFSGKSFEWQSISPIEQPDLVPRLFYSALVYVTLGSLLYSLGFYKFLYSLYRGTRGGWRKYKDTKAIIWWSLILGMYFIIIPFVVDGLNAVISVCFNLFNLILYLCPPFVITVFVFLVFLIYKKNILKLNFFHR